MDINNMSVTLSSEEIEIKREFNQLLATCSRCTEEGKELIKKAFRLAYEAHKGTRRKSGEPYIIHPISVARIVHQEIGLGTTSIVSSLLHDVVEDTEYTLEDISRHFGPKIASIIDGLTKISGVFDANSSIQAENFRKMLLTLAEDVRVIFIKLADRLHNMRTLGSMPVHKQMKIASETIYLYAPLAHRLGLYSIKTELEDLSLKYRHPSIYNELSTKIKRNEHFRDDFLSEFKKPIVERLEEYGLGYEITARQKSVYSIWQKIQKKSVPFEEVYDLMAIRIIFDGEGDLPEKTQCWNIYSLITDIYMPKPERIRDWVSTPKANGYEALHATVMGPGGNWVEVQIRSRRMDDIAEHGFAAHWKYKQNKEEDNEIDKWIKNLKHMLETSESDALEFLDDFKLNLFTSEIFIFTPKGDVYTMPNDINALDFAYEIHSQIGHKAIGAKVNHKTVSLHHELKSGDQVEIITSNKVQPRIEWLSKVNTVKAKTAIKNLLKSENADRIVKGKEILDEKLKELNLKPNHRIFRKLLPYFQVSSKDELYSKIGMGLIKLENLKKILKKNTQNKWIKYWGIQTGIKNRKTSINPTTGDRLKDAVLLQEGVSEKDINYVISECCNPIPGDLVTGFKDEYNQVIIHKTNCPEAIKQSSTMGHLIVPVKWTMHKVYSFLVTIGLNGTDRFGIYNDITTVISKELNVDMRNINLTSHDGIWEGTIELYVHNTKDLNNLILNLGKIKNVNSVKRIEKNFS